MSLSTSTRRTSVTPNGTSLQTQGIVPVLGESTTACGDIARRHPRELELLLLCARMYLDGEGLARVEALVGQEVDWDVLVTTAHQHRVLPLVYRTLRTVAGPSIRESALRRLAAGFQANGRRNLFLTSELLRVIAFLHAHDIPCIPYKGPALATWVYGNVALRQFADLDIIVPRDDVVRARALLASRGYRPEKRLSDDELRACLASEKDITLLRDDGPINLEVHWGITTHRDPIRVRPESLWKNLDTCTIGGNVLPTLSRESLLLVLCIHGAKHFWERLAWVCDIAEIVRYPGGVDWQRALDGADRIGGRRLLFLGLSLARELLGAEPPIRVVQAMNADRAVGALTMQVKDWLFSGEPVQLDLGERERYFMRLREKPADRCRVALRQARQYLAPTLRDREALPVPGFLNWSLYLLRPVRLAGVYGFAPVKRFFSGLFQA